MIAAAIAISDSATPSLPVRVKAIVRWSRKRFEGLRIGIISKPAPSAAGVHFIHHRAMRNVDKAR